MGLRTAGPLGGGSLLGRGGRRCRFAETERLEDLTPVEQIVRDHHDQQGARDQDEEEPRLAVTLADVSAAGVAVGLLLVLIRPFYGVYPSRRTGLPASSSGVRRAADAHFRVYPSYLQGLRRILTDSSNKVVLPSSGYNGRVVAPSRFTASRCRSGTCHQPASPSRRSEATTTAPGKASPSSMK